MSGLPRQSHGVQTSLASFLSATLAISILGGAARAAGPERPNVILIMADDLGYGDLSCYGGERNRTPQIDKLAAGGLRLTDFYCGAAVCTPSRMALLTGCYPTRLGWRGGVLGYKMKTSTGLAPEVTTMAEVFKRAGYRTGIFGKWHIGSSPELLPANQGFDEAFYIRMSNNQTKKLWRNDKLHADPFDNRRLSEEFTREAIRFIRAGGEKPFFAYLPYSAPHFPAEAHPDWKGKSKNGAYGDVVEELDARIGEIVAALSEGGIEKQTIVVFTSDNGPERGQRNFATAAPLRGMKWTSLEGGTRVPCIVSWPGKVKAGGVSDDLVAAVDLLPTLAGVCGIEFGRDEASPAIDGVDVWASLEGGGDAKHARGDLLYWEGWSKPQAIRAGTWKLFFDEVKDVPGSDAGPVLFNLSADAAEEKNVAAKHPERVAEMLALAKKRLAEIEAGGIRLGGTTEDPPASERPRWLK